MGQTVSDCKVQACKPSDPTADTVRVDPDLVAPESPLAQKPVPVPEESEEAKRLEEELRLEEERRQAAEEEEERSRLAEAEEARRRAEEAEAERVRQEEERVRQEEERVRQEEAARAERAAREERERAAEAERVKVEQARAAAAKQREEAAAAQQAVDDFLKSKGFKNLAVPRKAFCGGAVYPLHVAVEENNAEVVKAMLLCGADKEVKDSSKKTAVQVAERCNKSGSHDSVVAALRGGA